MSKILYLKGGRRNWQSTAIPLRRGCCLSLLLLCGLVGCTSATLPVAKPIKNEVCPVLVTATSGSIVATTTVMLTVQSKTLDNGCQWQ
jgi:hypothetical protein